MIDLLGAFGSRLRGLELHVPPLQSGGPGKPDRAGASGIQLDR
jgi:hypothetical protein